MNAPEHYYHWLRDAYAMERQSESLLTLMIDRTHAFPELHARLSQHLIETKRHSGLLDDVIKHNHLSRSVLQDAMSTTAAFGKSLSGLLSTDETVNGVIKACVFKHVEIACYTVLIVAAEKAGDAAALAPLHAVLAEECAMADWLLQCIPKMSERFLQHPSAPNA